MRASKLSMLLTLAAVAACGGRQAADEPVPEPTPAPAPAPESTPAPVATSDSGSDSERMAREHAELIRAVTADLSTPIHFDYDQATVRGDDRAVLDRKAAILKANPNARIRVSGHADERGSDEYNLALGNRRAGAAKRHLQNKGIEAARMEAISYGEERPMSQATDEAAYAQNRRDEFELTAGGETLVAPQ